MATLKICVQDRVYWITQVKEIIELRSFYIQEGEETELMEHAFDGSIPTPEQVTVVSFAGQSRGHGVGGKVLRVIREADSEPQTWVIPERSTYLMSDSGETIDRIG